MKKWPFTIWLLFSFSAAFGQQAVKDSIFQNVKNKSSNLFSERICSYYLDMAENLVRKDSICLPQYKHEFPVTDTYVFWLKSKYSIYDYSYCSGCIILCSDCFDDYMIWAIEQKFGKGFLEAQIKISDSLDSIGQGFKDVRYPLSEDSLRQFIYLKAQKKPFEEYPHKLVCFDIDEKGNVADILVFEGQFNMKQLPETNELNVLLKKLFKNDKKWTPAMFLGKPIRGYYFLPLSL
ncbi:hypothetical protein [Sporocytophaga myxococcoides]|nr:hypothetical protein [Sporocytophaga myxococcoides]